MVGGAWYGAKAAGLDNFAGIGGRPAGGQGPVPSLYAGMADGPKGQEMYQPPAASVPGAMVAQSSPAGSPTASPPPAAAQAVASGKSPMADIFGMMALAPQQQAQFSPVQIMGPSSEQANALSSLIASLKGRMA
jgi:hypothetical protein